MWKPARPKLGPPNKDGLGVKLFPWGKNPWKALDEISRSEALKESNGGSYKPLEFVTASDRSLMVAEPLDATRTEPVQTQMRPARVARVLSRSPVRYVKRT